MAIYIEPTQKTTEFLKYSENLHQKNTEFLKYNENSQSKHKKTTSGSGFEEILRKEQERIEKGKQNLDQIGNGSDNRDIGRNVVAELLKCKSRNRHIHSTESD